MGKKKVLYHSNFSKILSGFGKNAKNILKYLQSTGKYDLIEVSNGVSENHKDLKKLPWKAIGGVPEDQSLVDKINKDPNLARSAQYGFLNIDKIVKEEKPDVYLGVEDIWGISPLTKKPWWNKINCMAWTTLDSLPILADAVKSAPKIKNYYVWASFAEKSMKKDHGLDHIKTLHGAVDTKNFSNLGDEAKSSLRSKFNIDPESFIIGFVFRNQLRKSVPNLIEGFKLFKKEFPQSKAKLLLHTNFSEGWSIPSLVEEKGIDPSDILCTYYCPKCKNYEVKPFSGQNLTCPFCKSEKSQNTVSITAGVNETQLNEVYNLMDVYCHPFTSGGQEIPIQEAKLCELITLVTNYSCGEDCSTSESGGMPLDWSEYREPGTQFIKASTYASSISKNLKKVFKMDLLKRSSIGKKARDFVINNYSIEVIGKKLEDIIDAFPQVDYDFKFEQEKRNENYNPPEIKDDSSWLIDIYKGVLKVDLDHNDEGHKHWMSSIKNGAKRLDILNHFKSVAVGENSKIDSSKSSAPVDFSAILKTSNKKKALFCINSDPEDVLLVTSLLGDFNKKNPDFDIFFATDPKFFQMVSTNPNIFKVIPFQPEMNDEKIMLGAGLEDNYFDACYNFNNVLSNYLAIENKSFTTYE
jgi:glycosyltransferase involved in cell wall biosynthesis